MAYRTTNPACPVCETGIAGTTGKLYLESWTCDVCGIEIHEGCYWGRTASIDEWREFLRQLEQTPVDDVDIAIICAMCRTSEAWLRRQLESLGK
jgi:ribosomal protein L37AE/L43A